MRALSSILAAFLVAVGITVNAQSARELYETAREHAHAGEYSQAQELLNTILLANAQHYDAKLLLAQVHAWQNQYTLALSLLHQLIHDFTPTADAYEMVASIRLWQEDYIRCRDACKVGLQLFPAYPPLQILHAKALSRLNQSDSAIAILQEVYRQDSSQLEAKQLLHQLEHQNLKNSIGLHYSYARFSNTFSPWHIASISYQRRFSNLSLTGRFNRAYMFNQAANQIETDVYARISRKSYAYLNLGVADAAILPSLRLGAEYFRLLPGQFEISGGWRGLYFRQVPVHVFTAQLGRYLSHYWISARGFMASVESQQEFTGQLTLRRYLQHTDHYCSVYASTGTTPLSIISINEVRRLGASSIGLEYQHPLLNNTLLLRSKAEYQQETYEEIRSTNRLTLQLSVEKRF